MLRCSVVCKCFGHWWRRFRVWGVVNEAHDIHECFWCGELRHGQPS